MQIAVQRIKRYIAAIKSIPKTLFRIFCKRKKVGDKSNIPPGINTEGKEKNGPIPNGFTEKNGNNIPYDTSSGGMMNGDIKRKDEIIQNFQTKIGQDMNFDLTPYNNDDDEMAKTYPEEAFHEEVVQCLSLIHI